MKSPKVVYVSVEKRDYLEQKANILKTQMQIVNLQKKIKDINLTRLNKVKQRGLLTNLFSNLSSKLDKLEQGLPEPKVPKQFQEKPVIKEIKVEEKKDKKHKKFRITEDQQEINRLDEELQEIQEKLRALNSG